MRWCASCSWPTATAGVASLYGVSGSGTRLDASPTESGENIGKLTVVMEGGGNAYRGGRSPSACVTPWASIRVHRSTSRPALFSFSTPLEIELRGQDMATLEVAGQRLAAMLRGNAHYADVKSTVEEGFPEIQIRFDQERAGALGLTTRQIADVVVKKVRGDVATRQLPRPQDRRAGACPGRRPCQRGEHPPADRQSGQYPSGDAGRGGRRGRHHWSPARSIALTRPGWPSCRPTCAISIWARPCAKCSRWWPSSRWAQVGLHIGGQGEELAQAAKSLIFAFGLAIFLVYLVMASQFESLLHPFVILFTIPLALVGAILALALTGKPISVVVFIGLILLVGLVTKNAIILIDKVNQLREAGVAKHEALVEGHARACGRSS